MKKQILDRIKALGGNVDHVQGFSLVDDLVSIQFNTVLYERPKEVQWATADQQEPIYGLAEYIEQHRVQFDLDPDAFFEQLIQHFYQLNEAAHGQTFWQPFLFTPYKVGTEDFEEWNYDFLQDDIHLKEVIEFTKNPEPDFVQVFYRYRFPDQFYICLSDPNPENPTLFGTDHETFFKEVTNQGSLEQFLNQCMTPDELIEIIKKKLNGENNG